MKNYGDTITAAEFVLKSIFAENCTIKASELLSEPDRRNIILRLDLKSPSNILPITIILKQRLKEEGDEDDHEAYARFARDWAGLEFLTKFKDYGHLIPQFYGGNRRLRFILQEDLGTEHQSLVDALTLPDEKAAIAALKRFMTSLGRMHAASFGHLSQYQQILARLHDGKEQALYDNEPLYQTLLSRLEKTYFVLGLKVSSRRIPPKIPPKI